MKPERIFFGRNVRYLRESRGWSKADLAQRMDYKESFINAIENESNPVSWSVIAQFASVFGKSMQIMMFTDIESAEKIPDLSLYFSNPSVVRPPKYYLDVGYDLITPTDFVVKAHDYAEIVVPTAIYPPAGHFAHLTTRGSTDRLRFHIDGTIDPTFDSHVLIAVKSSWKRSVTVKAGTAIAQVIFLAYFNPHSQNLNLPRRGDKKRGSTGQ